MLLAWGLFLILCSFTNHHPVSSTSSGLSSQITTCVHGSAPRMYLKIGVLPCVGQMVAISKGTEGKHVWCKSYSMCTCSKQPIPEALSHLSPDSTVTEGLASVSLLRQWFEHLCSPVCVSPCHHAYGSAAELDTGNMQVAITHLNPYSSSCVRGAGTAAPVSPQFLSPSPSPSSQLQG